MLTPLLGALLVVTTPTAAIAGSDPATTLADKAGESGSATCRNYGQPEETCNQVPAGSHPSAEAVDAHASSWTHGALAFQYELARDVPLVDAPWIGTHNSYNSPAYGFTPSRSDSNQQLTLGQQLRIDVRSLEIDIHWIRGRPVVCHGTAEHAGCSREGEVREMFDEIAAWMREPANRDQVLLLYLEDHIKNTQGYDTVTAELERAFGPKLYRGAGGKCSEKLPLSLTRSRVRLAGARVIAVASGCGGGSEAGGATAWSRVVFDWSGDVQSESRPRGFEDFPGCGPDFDRARYSAQMIRYFEDSTFVSHTPASSTDEGLTPETTAAMTRCGVDLLGFDQLLPDDGRLEAAVWSWRQGEPVARGDCARQRRADARWAATRCRGLRPAACRDRGGEWSVTKRRVRVGRADSACRRQGARFAVPRTGYENELLRAATPRHRRAVWLALREKRGGWRAQDRRRG